MTEKRNTGHIITDILSTTAGGLAGGLGASALRNAKLAPLHNVMNGVVDLVQSGKTAEALEKVMQHSSSVNADDASLVIEAIEHMSEKKMPSESATKALNNFFQNVAEKELKGVAKFAHKHPHALLAGGVIAGGTLAMGAVSALRGNENQHPQSFSAREDARRAEAAAQPSDITR